jgi:mono/diheme cytochrome c family protein
VTRVAEKPPAVTADAATLEKGFTVFHQTCTVCHGFFAESAGVLPDLRMSSNAVFASYKEIVLDGSLAANGMASFADNLTADDVEAVRQYVLSQANTAWAAAHPGEAPAAAPTP